MHSLRSTGGVGGLALSELSPEGRAEVRPGLRRGMRAGLLFMVGAWLVVAAAVYPPDFGQLVSLAVAGLGIACMAWAMLLMDGD